MKTILYITYYFSPIGRMPTFRAMRFVKYLPLHSWKPVVLTLKNMHTLPLDKGLQDDLSNRVEVYRSYDLSLIRILHKLREITRRRKAAVEADPQAGDRRVPSRAGRRLVRKVVSLVMRYFSSPNTAWGWLVHSVLLGSRIIKNKDIDVIYSTSGPHSSNVIGLVLARIFRKPWICEFRDAWVDLPYANFASRIQRKMSSFLERNIFSHADQVIVLTTSLQNLYSRKYPFAKNKIVTIYNSFDKSEYEKAATTDRGEYKKVATIPARSFVITYTGNLYGGRRIDAFLRAFRTFLSIVPEGVRPRFQVIGTYDVDEISSLVEYLNLNAFVRLCGRKSHKQVLNILQQSDLLLLVKMPRDNIHIPGKFFEYLGAGIPILVLSNSQEVRDIVHRCGAGICVDPLDDEAIWRAMFTLFEESASYSVRRNTEECEKFEASVTTGLLSTILDDLLWSQGTINEKN